MFAIAGASGKVGSATCRTLRAAGVPVRAVVHSRAEVATLEQAGCEIVPADLQDVDALTDAIAGASAVQAIIPLRPQVEDPAADMLRSIESIVAALARARPAQILAISDYGAHVDGDIGMPTIFRIFEQHLRELNGTITIVRSAEHMHNWGRNIPDALASGTLPSFQVSTDMAQPTIAADDLGRISAELLLRSAGSAGVEVVHAEGPQRYSANDVADALGQTSGRSIEAQAIPRQNWESLFTRTPASLANLLIKANDAKNLGGLVDVEPGAPKVLYGQTELLAALRALMPTS